MNLHGQGYASTVTQKDQDGYIDCAFVSRPAKVDQRISHLTECKSAALEYAHPAAGGDSHHSDYSQDHAFRGNVHQVSQLELGIFSRWPISVRAMVSRAYSSIRWTNP